MSRVSDYSFVNAKLRARIGVMHDSHLIDEMIKAPTLVEAVAKLDGTRFAHIAEVYRSTGDMQQAELSMVEEEIATYREIASYLPDRPSGFLTVLLEKAEMDNLKNALRLWYSEVVRHHHISFRSAYVCRAVIVHRIDYVLTVNGIVLSDTSYADVLHLQIQFLFGIISMMVLVILFLIINRRYNTWMAYEARLDALTGALTRRAFFQACSRTLKTLSQQEGPLGYFIMLDLDFFKDINDTQGHPEGDRALREVAKALRDSFGRDCLISRLGGDEFALLICSDISKPELEVTLRHFMERIHRITFGQRGLTCSIGALPVRPDCAPEQLYLEADRLLYTAKEQGRNQYVIGS